MEGLREVGLVVGSRLLRSRRVAGHGRGLSLPEFWLVTVMMMIGSVVNCH